MATSRFEFESFCLDPNERLLTNNGAPVEVTGRYLDALALLVREQGRLVSKDRFLDEVWRGVPVTDEALTQCIKALRRQLGDEASRPRFIETVPKHGYRFIAPVRSLDGGARENATAPRAYSWQQFLLLGAAGTIGGGLAGFIGGLFYGFAGASQPLQPGMGAISILLVLLCVTILMALIGGAGVAFGIAAAGWARGRQWAWRIAGGAAGGLIVGAVVKLLGLDAFNLLIGRSPGDITGPFEGLVVGTGVGIGAVLASAQHNKRRGIVAAALSGGIAGIIVALSGGRLMGGSLNLLAQQFPASRLRLDNIGALFGEAGFGPVSQVVTAGMEGALFSACVASAMALARRSLVVVDRS